MAKQISLQIS